MASGMTKTQLVRHIAEKVGTNNKVAAAFLLTLSETAVKETKAGKVEYRVDKTGVIHTAVGKVSFEENKIAENARALIEAVVKAKPSTAKGKYMKKVNLDATMSPGVLLDETAFAK